MTFFDRNRNGGIFIPDSDGHFVSDSQRRVADILRDYDPNLELQWIPPGNRSAEDVAFRVVCRAPGREPYVVCFADECDERLLAKVFKADNTRNGGTLNYVDAHNAAVEAVRLRERLDAQQEMHDLAYSVLRSNKIHYKHGGIDFGKPFGGRLG